MFYYDCYMYKIDIVLNMLGCVCIGNKAVLYDTTPITCNPQRGNDGVLRLIELCLRYIIVDNDECIMLYIGCIYSAGFD